MQRNRMSKILKEIPQMIDNEAMTKGELAGYLEGLAIGLETSQPNKIDYRDYDRIIQRLVRFWITRADPHLEMDLFLDFCVEELGYATEDREIEEN